jgi:hypothetical protein
VGLSRVPPEPSMTPLIKGQVGLLEKRC